MAKTWRNCRNWIWLDKMWQDMRICQNSCPSCHIRIHSYSVMLSPLHHPNLRHLDVLEWKPTASAKVLGLKPCLITFFKWFRMSLLAPRQSHLCMFWVFKIFQTWVCKGDCQRGSLVWRCAVVLHPHLPESFTMENNSTAEQHNQHWRKSYTVRCSESMWQASKITGKSNIAKVVGSDGPALTLPSRYGTHHIFPISIDLKCLSFPDLTVCLCLYELQVAK